MDFFAEQRVRTRRSLLLYGLFLLIVVAHMVVALGIMALLLTLFMGGVYYWVMVLVIVWTLFSFMAGSFFEYRRLKAGGRAIAQRVGAVRLFIDGSQDAWKHSSGVAHQHTPVSPVRYSARHIAVRHERDFPPLYRRYYEFAQQLAIAAGISMPILYVLPNEQGINAFVAGRHAKDMVLVVTQGALDKLSDEALYGLIGHEYGHILHGDAKFNLQLMVVLAGLQILYDWSDPIENLTAKYGNHDSYFDNAANQNIHASQKVIDSEARITESKTANFTTHAEWVAYWQQHSQYAMFTQSSQHIGRVAVDSNAPRSVWTLLLHGLSFSSMASAQLIKHSFNRERELLADATSVQLTRSPAILETLKAIHQDSLGSRLSNIADINGLSHFFFASSGSDLGDVSWFATHPSLSERMSAINAKAYQSFATQVAKQQRLNQQKIKEIYEQRRSGTWGSLKENSLSKKLDINNKTIMTTSTKSKALKVSIDTVDDSSAATNNDTSSNILFDTLSISQNETDAGLEFAVEEEVIIDGRLQVTSEAIGTYKLLKPWQALTEKDLSADELISNIDIQKISLPNDVLNHSHHPLGAQALIESILLCHQGRMLSTTFTYSLTDIWCGLSESFIESGKIETDELESNDKLSKVRSKRDGHSNARLSKEYKILPHTIDHKLLENIAKLDRRMDSALIAITLKRLRQHDLSEIAISQLKQRSEFSHSVQDYQHYQRELNSRTMLVRYQQGLIDLFDTQLKADLTDKLDINQLERSEPRHPHQPSILELWQALHLQQLLPILSEVLGSDKRMATENDRYTPQLDTSSLYAQLDPSAQIFENMNAAERAMLVIFAYRLAKDTVGSLSHSSKRSLPNALNKEHVVTLRRHARLIDIELKGVSDANLQWLLLTAQHLNSIQLLAIIDTIPAHIDTSKTALSLNEQVDKKLPNTNQIAYNTYRLWLGTLHTVMLHDTIISQDEYDCLTILTEHWIGIRQLLD